jgi:carboxylesterase
VVLASNHQSWLDIFTLIASSPRRVYFVAKGEFEHWPFVRHVIRFSDSMFIQRGGGKKGLDSVIEALQNGRTVAIYPEGTIPGEEDIPRRRRDPRTGLLSGRTGAVRLAIKARVPIVPIGVSGTERVLPPEVWPRMELPRLPSATPITIRFGKPVYFNEYKYEDIDHFTLRRLTDDLMTKISELVDHRANFVPTAVPAPKPYKTKRLGVLLLHGFTSNLNTVSDMIPHLEKAGIDYAMPVLRGHNTRYEELEGVTAKDWYVDAERALIDLWDRVDKVIIVGLSMGGLVALELAMRHPGKIAGVVSVATALKFKNPLARFSGSLAATVKYFPSPEAFNSEHLQAENKNYEKFPVATFASLYEYSRSIASRLGEVHVPIRILQSKKDGVVSPVAASIIYAKVSSPKREIIWYEDSGHEMFLDLEAEQVIKDTMKFIEAFHKHPEDNQVSTEDQTQVPDEKKGVH